MDDATLKQHVLDQLASRSDIDSAHIGVIADDGVITLFGKVRDYAQKVEAERLVTRVMGVRGIAEELEVRYGGDYFGDDEIAQRALACLAWKSSVPWEAFVPKGSVQVTVEKGIVTLSGQVTRQFQRTAAEDMVRTLYGVVDVINNIALRTQPVLRCPKSYPQSAVRWGGARRDTLCSREHVPEGQFDSGSVRMTEKCI